MEEGDSPLKRHLKPFTIAVRWDFTFLERFGAGNDPKVMSQKSRMKYQIDKGMIQAPEEGSNQWI